MLPKILSWFSPSWTQYKTLEYQSSVQHVQWKVSLSVSDRRDQSQWSPMTQQRSFHGVPPYGQTGMSPSGPPNISHMSRIRMSPNRNREYAMSPNNKVSSYPCMLLTSHLIFSGCPWCPHCPILFIDVCLTRQNGQADFEKNFLCY